MKHRILVALTALWTTAACAAPLVMTGAPNGSWSQMHARFAPIARYLSAALHRPVVFRNSGDLVNFGQNILHRRVDILFGGPQILSWADKQYGYVPILAARGSLSFSLVARSRRFHAISDLDSGETVCGLPPPNLGTMVLMAHYPNPLRQPDIIPVSSPMAAIRGVSDGRCLAAAVPTRLAVAHASLHVRVVAPLGRFPNQGFVVSSRLAPALRHRIAQALMAGARAGVLRPLQSANGITGWRSPGPKHYLGYGHFIQGVLGYVAFHARPVS